MRKSVLAGGALTLAVLVGGAVPCVWAVTPRPQRGAAARGARRAHWEYAVISRVSEIGRGAPPDINYRGVATICYVLGGGCRQLQVEGSDRVEALARALAKLGGEGWEMVGESPFPVGPGSEGALFFKRPAR